jgi:hypothetical protein
VVRFSLSTLAVPSSPFHRSFALISLVFSPRKCALVSTVTGFAVTVFTHVYLRKEWLLLSCEFLITIDCSIRSRVSSGSIVSDYGLDDRAIRVRSPVGAKDFSSNLCVQTGSGAHPASCTMGSGGPFPGGKSAAGA